MREIFDAVDAAGHAAGRHRQGARVAAHATARSRQARWCRRSRAQHQRHIAARLARAGAQRQRRCIGIGRAQAGDARHGAGAQGGDGQHRVDQPGRGQQVAEGHLKPVTGGNSAPNTRASARASERSELGVRLPCATTRPTCAGLQPASARAASMARTRPSAVVAAPAARPWASLALPKPALRRARWRRARRRQLRFPASAPRRLRPSRCRRGARRRAAALAPTAGPALVVQQHLRLDWRLVRRHHGAGGIRRCAAPAAPRPVPAIR